MKDMRLGTLVGTRTAHRLRPAASNLLDDGSPLALPANGQLRADQELINGIGVPPGYYLPLTAQGPPAGEDPAIAQAPPCSAAGQTQQAWMPGARAWPPQSAGRCRSTRPEGTASRNPAAG